MNQRTLKRNSEVSKFTLKHNHALCTGIFLFLEMMTFKLDIPQCMLELNDFKIQYHI